MTILSEENAVALHNWPIDPITQSRTQPERTRLLLVDDDDDFREAAAIELDDLGFCVTAVPDGESMVKYFAEGNRCEAIILDWKLPRRAGVGYLRSLRQLNVTIPVVILTGLPETAYESTALDSGAEDFIDKSRGLEIVAKRVRRILAAQTGGLGPAPGTSPPEVEVRSGKLLLRVSVSRAYWDGIDLNLTVTEFNIVHLMVTNAGEHVTYRAIYDCVHHPGFVAGSGEDGYRTNVRSAVKRIRNKFRALDEQFCQIENFSAFGYRWLPGPAEIA